MLPFLWLVLGVLLLVLRIVRIMPGLLMLIMLVLLSLLMFRIIHTKKLLHLLDTHNRACVTKVDIKLQLAGASLHPLTRIYSAGYT